VGWCCAGDSSGDACVRRYLLCWQLVPFNNSPARHCPGADAGTGTSRRHRGTGKATYAPQDAIRQCLYVNGRVLLNCALHKSGAALWRHCHHHYHKYRRLPHTMTARYLAFCRSLVWSRVCYLVHMLMACLLHTLRFAQVFGRAAKYRWVVLVSHTHAVTCVRLLLRQHMPVSSWHDCLWCVCPHTSWSSVHAYAVGSSTGVISDDCQCSYHAQVGHSRQH
jgi:hypothetical protein